MLLNRCRRPSNKATDAAEANFNAVAASAADAAKTATPRKR